MGGLELLLSTILLNATLGEVPSELNFAAVSAGFQNKTQRLQDLRNYYNGRHLKIGTIQNYPLSCANLNDNNTWVGCGVAFEIVEMMVEMFNFTYEVVLPRENYEGSKSKPQDSLLGLLNKNEIDLAAAFLPALSDSMEFVRYSASLDEGDWVIMMNRPRESAQGSGLLAPFDVIVWYMILVAVLSFAPFIYLVTWIRYISTKDEKNKPYTMAPCFWFVYGALIKQGSTLSPDANTTRVLFATWWIFITLLSAFYTANLTAFLTLSKFTLSINEPQDLVKKNNKWIAKKGSAVEYVVTNPDEDLYFLNKMVLKNRASFQPGIDDAIYLPFVKNNYVFVRDKPAVDHLMYNDYKNKTKENVEESLRCTYVITQKSFMKKPRSFAYPNNSSLPLLFDPVILSLVESGIITYKTRYELPGNEICPLNLKSKERRLRNGDLSMTYKLAGFGIFVGLLSFIIEVAYHHRGRFCKTALPNQDGNRKNIGNNKMSKLGKISPGPPPYQSIFQTIDTVYGSMSKRQQINGRDYWVLKESTGETRLIPVRTPSALLFQYTS